VYGTLRDDLAERLEELRGTGLYKTELVMTTPQGSHVDVNGRGLLNLCANNYLGLAGHPSMVEAAHQALDRWGYGMASVRFICGTQALHRELEERLSSFLGTDDTILFSSCFDANGGLFEALLNDEDAVISDQLNHASIIDGVRLCKARRLRYANGDMNELEARLDEAAGARYRLIATDGVFSMDGYLAQLDQICDLAERHDALVMVDDSHAVGVVGLAAAARTTTTAWSSASTYSRGRSAKRSAGRAAATCQGGPKSLSSCVSARDRTCSPTASHPPSLAPASAHST
jgi:glycine C-acetyltransferase